MNKTIVDPNQQQISDFIKVVMSTGQMSYDIETNGLDQFTGKILMLQYGANNGDVLIFTKTMPKRLIKLMPQVTVLGHNLKFDMKWGKHHLNMKFGKVWDTMIVESVLNLGKPLRVGLGHLTERYLGIAMDKTTRNAFIGREERVFTQKEIDYGAEDVRVLFKIKNKQLEKLESMKSEGIDLTKVVDLENKVVEVTAELEYNGVLLDSEKWLDLMAPEEVELFNVCKKAHALMPSSKPILGNLFGEPPVKNYIEASGISSNQNLLKYFNEQGFKLESVDGFELTAIKEKSELADLVLQYRSLYKRINTYYKPIIEEINPVTGRFHAPYTQLSMWARGGSSGTTTGRYSAKRIHQIPADKAMRHCFIARPDHKIATLDYSGVEMVIAANMSKDPALLAFFAGDLTDFHGYTASLVFNQPIEMVSKMVVDGVEQPAKLPKLRAQAKMTNYALLYGITAKGLAKRLEISVEEAQNIIDGYYDQFPVLMRMIKGFQDFGEKNRYITDPGIGRVRFFPDTVEDWQIPTRASNFPIQTTNASQIKLSMYRILKTMPESKLLLTVHDELAIEAHKDIIEREALKAKAIMIKSASDILGGPVEYDTGMEIMDSWTK